MSEQGLITIWHNGQSLLLNPEVAETLDLRDCQHVDETTLWRALDLNTAVLRAHADTHPISNAVLKAAQARVINELETRIAAHYAARERV